MSSLSPAVTAAFFAWIAVQAAAEPPRERLPDVDLGGVEPKVAAKIVAARRYAASRPESAHAWGVLAMSLDVHGFRREALPCYERAAALDPEEIRWPYYRAIVLAELGAPEALEWLERARALRSDYPPLLVRYGDALLDAGDPVAARELFAAAAAADPALSHAHLGLARAALTEGDDERALGHARRAVEAEPRHAEAHGLLAELHRRHGDPRRAEQERLLMRRLPSVTRLADPIYTALVAEGVSSYWHRQRGRAHLERGEYERAVHELEEAISAAPSRAELHDDLGIALQSLGRHQEASEHHRAALELQPGFSAALVHLGTALDGTGRLEEAIVATEQAVELRANLLEAALNLGTFYLRAGRRQAAAGAFRRGLDHHPDDLRLSSRLAWLLATAPEAELRDGDEALHLARRACETTGYRLPEALDVLAAAQAEAGRFEQAVETARRARTLASEGGRVELTRRIGARLELYVARKPYREGSLPH